MEKKKLFGASQGSILGLLLSNIFLYDLFFTINYADFSCYVDNNIPFFLR